MVALIKSIRSNFDCGFKQESFFFFSTKSLFWHLQVVMNIVFFSFFMFIKRLSKLLVIQVNKIQLCG